MLESEKAELLEIKLAESLQTRVEGVLVKRYSIIGAIAALVLTSFITLSVKSYRMRQKNLKARKQFKIPQHNK